ncbi:hypothetical protein D3C71_1523860 [compost metagenome]
MLLPWLLGVMVPVHGLLCDEPFSKRLLSKLMRVTKFAYDFFFRFPILLAEGEMGFIILKQFKLFFRRQLG